ncbi:ATP synthase subunit B family protein [Candidatus Bandiella euplotis]|uniref:ATP synthase subunit b n=1 Tax=Candidatus Bandiella euplotis TaxID=1664265 RepID=A0ABZ0UJZ7_9RICK|nr:hypothetical protein [Candidatus Bandiella woodruffii]WPX96019.1 ATP synthase subunit b [Candidatus Bandiella woodruffii]
MINETTWLFIALIAVLFFGYKPTKSLVSQFLDAKINDAKRLLQEAEKVYKDAEILLKTTEKNLAEQLVINTQKIDQVKEQLSSLRLQNEKEIEMEIERQFQALETQRVLTEEVLRQELKTIVINENVASIIDELKKSDSKDISYIMKSLNKYTLR